MKVLSVLYSASLLFGLAVAEETKVLMIGNSYTVRNSLSLILEKLLQEGTERNCRVTRSATGGARFTHHVLEAYGYYGTDSPLRQYLVTRPTDWDYVILQEQSQLPGFLEYDSLFGSSSDAAVRLFKMATKTGAQSIFYVTWGRRDGDYRNPRIYPDFATMQAKLNEGYTRFVEACQDDDAPRLPPILAPVGTAFRIIHDRYVELGLNPRDPQSNFYRLYSSDGSHPSRQGSYLAACVLYATMTGGDPRDLEYVPSGISENEKIMLQSVAAMATLGEQFDPEMMTAEMQSIPVDSPYPTIPPSTAPSMAPDEDADNEEMCSSIVLNADMELGGEGYWYGHGVGAIRDVSPGYNSDTAIRSMERHRYWDGPGYMINMTRERVCLRQGSKWEVTAQLKLVDSKTDEGASCSISDSSPYISCPQIKFRLRDSKWQLSDYVIKGYTSKTWNANGFNKFRAVFTVPEDSADWEGRISNVAVFFHMYHPDLDLIVDDFNIVKME